MQVAPAVLRIPCRVCAGVYEATIPPEAIPARGEDIVKLLLEPAWAFEQFRRDTEAGRGVAILELPPASPASSPAKTFVCSPCVKRIQAARAAAASAILSPVEVPATMTT